MEKKEGQAGGQATAPPPATAKSAAEEGQEAEEEGSRRAVLRLPLQASHVDSRHHARVGVDQGRVEELVAGLILGRAMIVGLTAVLILRVV
jgi:hypothetical protein